MVEAKEHFLKLKEEHNKETELKNKKALETENRLKQVEQSLKDKLANIGKQEKENEELKIKYNSQLEILNAKKEDLEKAHQQHIQKLEQIA